MWAHRTRKDIIMRYQNGIMPVVALVLAMITVTGIAYTEQFPQAAHAEAVGFDALAHALFASDDSADPAEAGK
jgi:hypothetical protein